jgi:exopolysaccharide transport family protein
MAGLKSMTRWKNRDNLGDSTDMPGPTERASFGRDQVNRPAYARPTYARPDSPHLGGTIEEFFYKIWRRRGLIITTIVVSMVVTATILFQITPRYYAEALIMIEGQRSNVINVKAVMSGLSGDNETIQSEIEVIRSRPLVEKVITTLALDRKPEFNRSYAPKGFIGKFFEENGGIYNILPKKWLDVIFGQKKQVALVNDNAAIETNVKGGIATINAFLKKLSVRQKGRSRVIGIGFTSTDPGIAGKVANSLAEFYVAQLLSLKVKATQRASSWLNKKVNVLRKQVKKAEAAVERYRNKSGLIEARGLTIISQQVAEVSTQVVIAKTDRVEAQARLRQTLTLLKSPHGIASAMEVLKSPLIQKLREQEAMLQRRAAELSGEYGKRHPKMINIRAEIKDIGKKIGQEVSKIVNGMRNEVEIARTRETSLVRTLKKLETDVSKANRAEVGLRALERDANASRNLLETFLARYKETSAQKGTDAQRADARIISMANIPIKPSFPKKGIILVLAFAGSLGFGVLLAFLMEMLDRGFRSCAQIEQFTDVAVFGLVPLLNRKVVTRQAAADYILHNTMSPFSEAIRTLHTSLLLSHIDEPPKRVLITSSQADEGKTTISISLARMQAMAGRRVLIIDADLRCPTIAKSIGIQEEPGLVDLLLGEAEYDDVINEDKASGVFVITAGKPTQNPPSLLASDRFSQVLNKLEESFDFLVIDSPPILAVSDSRVLTTKVDATVLVVRWASTSRDMVMTSIKQLDGTFGSLSGIVLSMVDLKLYSRYKYGSSYYSRGASHKYYSVQ